MNVNERRSGRPFARVRDVIDMVQPRVDNSSRGASTRVNIAPPGAIEEENLDGEK